MSNQNIIKLNVGGTIFQTTISTLTRFDGFFKTMLETDVPLATDPSDAIFIDRPAEHFNLILSYMRGDTIDRSRSETVRQEILTEARFYLLDGLVKLFEAPKIRYLKDFEEVLNAFAYTEKKAVLIVYYTPSVEGASRMVGLVNKFREEFDVFFYHSQTKHNYSNEWSFEVHVESSGFFFAAKLADLDKMIQNNVQ
ncbi:unnamed protein product [Caenorhabditis brenneri]